MEMEKEEDIWRRKISREGTYLVSGGKKERRGKEEENIWSAEKKKKKEQVRMEEIGLGLEWIWGWIRDGLGSSTNNNMFGFQAFLT